MILTKEEYDRPIVFRNKQIDNSTLALKFHNAVRKTFDKLLKEPNTFTTIKNKTEVTTITNEDIKPKWYPRSGITLEFTKHIKPKTYWDRYSKREVQEFDFNHNKDIEYILNMSKENYDDSDYFKAFIKFTSLQSKNFKKKLIKVVYIFENEPSDRKYRKVFNFLVNYYNLSISQNVNNYDNKTKKLIEPNKLRYYTDVYQLTNYSPILPPREDRNRKINKILKSKDLVDTDN